MLSETVQAICPACMAAIENQISTAGPAPLEVEWLCPHRGVGLCMRVDAGAVVGWTLFNAPSPESFVKTLAFRAGGRAGVEAHLAAEAALQKAGGEPAH